MLVRSSKRGGEISEIAKFVWGAIGLFLGIQVGLALHLHSLILVVCVAAVGATVYTAAEMLSGFRPGWIADEMRQQIFDADGYLLKKRAVVHVNADDWPKEGKVADFDIEEKKLLVRFPDKRIAAFPMSQDTDGKFHVAGILNRFVPI